MRSSIFALAALLALPPLANAQLQASTATGETGLFTVLAADTLQRRSWSFGLYYNNRDRVIGLDDGDFPDLSDPEIDWGRMSAAFGYGITDRWELSAAFPFDDYGYSHHEGVFGPALNTAGPNNVRVAAKYRLWDRPDARTHLAVDVFGELPTGDDEVASDRAGFGALVAGQTAGFLYNVGMRHPGNDEHFEHPRQILFSGGYSREIVDRFDWISEVTGTILTGGDESPTSIRHSLDVTTGGRLWFQAERRWSVNFGARLNVLGLSGLGGLIGVTLGNP
jgi:hypothetical protein